MANDAPRRPMPPARPARPSPLTPSVRYGRLIASMPLIAIGVTCMVRADLGVSPFDVLNTGVNERAGIPFAVAYLLVCGAFFAAGTALGSPPGWASVVGVAVVAPLLQLFLAITPEPENLLARAVLLAAGVAVIAFAICLVITTELGPGPSEVFMLGLAHRGVPLVGARWIADGVPLVVGALIGGALGIGTAVFALAMAPLVAAGLRWLRYTPERRAPGARRPSAGA